MAVTPHNFPRGVSYAVFFASGAAAIVYQILWQRAVFTMFGSDNQSVTIVVSAFMLGLGVGSLVGGWLSNRFPGRLIQMFAAVEASIGLFGLVSLDFFAALRGAVLHSSGTLLHIASFFTVAAPAGLMGITLPLLVAYLVKQTQNVGDSVGVLYYVNTMGSAIGCLVGVAWLFRTFGMHGSITVAAGVNIGVAVVVLAVDRMMRGRG